MITLEQACNRFQAIQEVMDTIVHRRDIDIYEPRWDLHNVAKAISDICYTMRQLYDLTGGFPHGEGAESPTDSSRSTKGGEEGEAAPPEY